MRKLQLTLACGDYEIVRPLKEGVVQPDGVELTVLTAMDSSTRHWRFLRNNEFDIAEVSSSSYIISRDRGLPFRAIPVFLHRRFRHGFIFINATKGIKQPSDLIGRKVGVKSYQVSAVLWLRGILEHEYGVPHTSIEWLSELDEDIDFAPPKGLKLSRIQDDKSIEAMLAEGEIDALLHPDIIDPIIAKDPRVDQLFPDYKAEEIAYYKKTGIFPIMHVMGLKEELVERHPWVVPNLYKAFDAAKEIAMKRMINPRTRAACLVSRGLGGARSLAWARSVAVRAGCGKYQESRNVGRVFLRTGSYHAAHTSRRTVPKCFGRAQAGNVQKIAGTSCGGIHESGQCEQDGMREHPNQRDLRTFNGYQKQI